ncbi:MAG: hypothetical protein LUC83_01905 [Clostridiales bacterium]|nr:hypothetical protein [Clostridiales bacterium]
MKKNKFMRLASGLLVLTLITTCAISGTFAKYVTDGSASDTARVANFGVVIDAGGTLYSDAYASDTGKPTTATVGISGTAATVNYAGTGEDNLVAPGTKSADNGLNFGVSGTPEVAVNVAADITAEDIYLGTGTWAVMTKVDNVTAENFTDFTDGLYTLSSGTYTVAASYDATADAYYQITDSATVSADYYPVVYTLAGSTTYSGSVLAASAQGVATSLAKAITGNDGINSSATVTDKYKTTYTNTVVTKNYTANIDLATTAGPALGNMNLTWVWDFDDSGSGTYDPQDTILGDLIAQENSALGTDSAVVYKSDTTGSYTAVDIDEHVVTAGSTVVAYLQTSFSIDLTVPQID